MPKTSHLRKIEVRLVVIEGEAVGGAELRQNLHDVLLLTGRELVLAVMIAVVRAVAIAEVVLHAPACLRPLVVGHVLVDAGEAPGLLHQLVLAETLTLPALPSRRIDGRTAKPLLRLHLAGQIVQALFALLTVVVKTKFISPRNIFQFKYVFHKT